MTWTKLGDEFGDQTWQLSDAAFRLHTEGLVWSNRKHLDGRLDKNEMLRWAKRPGAADELVAIGFWEDRGEHFQIIHGLGWQRTAEQWFHQSAVNARNRRKGKARPVRPKDKSSNDSSNDSSDERDWSGLDRTGMDESGRAPSDAAEKNGADPDLSGADFDVCRDCRENAPVGSGARGNDDPLRCRSCNDDRLADVLDGERSSPWRGQGPDPFEEYR